MDFTTVINGRTLEYIDDGHIYTVDGIQVPSITQMLKTRFGRKYDGIDKSVLRKASEAGTKVHEAIERYCKTGEQSEYPEVRNFQFLQRVYGFRVVDNEVPVIIERRNVPIAAGRVDLIVQHYDYFSYGIADIKRTATLDKEYLSYQLNLYKIAYEQTYGVHISLLRGVHLRENVRKYVPIPINEQMAIDFIDDYLKYERKEKNESC